MLQRLPAAEMLMHYMDLHSYDVAKAPSTELAEVVMDEILSCKLNLLRDAGVLIFLPLVPEK